MKACKWTTKDLTCKLGKSLLLDLKVQGKKVKVLVLTAAN